MAKESSTLSDGVVLLRPWTSTDANFMASAWADLFDLGAARVFLTIESENAASAAVARRAGFTYEGTLREHRLWQGERKDVDVFAVLAREWPDLAND